MKQSFFNELSVALEGRSRVFKLVVITSLIFCTLVFLEFAMHILQDKPPQKSSVAASVQKTSNQVMPLESITLKRK